MPKMTLTNFYLSDDLILEIDLLVGRGIYKSRAEAVRSALTDLIQFWKYRRGDTITLAKEMSRTGEGETCNQK